MLRVDDSVGGPFGNPDGSRADLGEVLEEFIDFDGDLTFGALAAPASDARARVIVGRLGAGKTVYLRRLQEFQGRQESVYADVPQQSLPPTECIVKACQWFSDRVLTEKWMRLWNRAIMRALTSHLLCDRQLRHHLTQGAADDLRKTYARLLDDFKQPRSIYGEVEQIIGEAHSGQDLTKFLDDPLWHDLEYTLAELLWSCPPIFFYLDAVDDEFEHAPMYWLRCQEGLFHQVMRLLRDARLGGKLHVVVSIRDVVMSSVLRSENAPRYIDEPHIRLLSWDRESLRYLLYKKLERLPPSCFVADTTVSGASVVSWLGRATIENRARGVTEDIEEYLLRHTRLIPRDLVSLGNALCKETRRRRAAGESAVPAEVVRAVVARAARRFGGSQLAQCSNQVAADMMPKNAALKNYSEVYTGTQAYIGRVDDEMRSIIQKVGVDRFGTRELGVLRDRANEEWEGSTDLPAVLWQNGLLGYVDGSGRPVFYSMGDADQFRLPEDFETFVFHPCVIDSTNIKSVGDEPVRPF